MLRTANRFVAPTRRPIAWIAIAIVAVAFTALIAVALLGPQSAFAATTTSSSSSVTDAQKTQRVVTDTNEVRAEAGTTPLVRNSALDKVAADWAYQQWKNGAMSHNPDYSTQIPAGWSHAGENVAAGYTYDTVVPAWVKSASHYKNLVGDYTDVGIGYYEGPDGKRYWSQVFAKYSTTQVPPKQTPTASASPSATTTPAPSASATPTPSATPSSTPSTAPSTAPGTSGSFAAEPAAPAGTAIALSSPSFEGSSTGWTASGSSVEGPTTAARGGKYDLALTGGTTVSQTVSTTVTAGETDTVTIWVKPGSATAITGSLKLSTLGGTTETATSTFSVSSGWMKVSVALPVSRSGHTGLKIEVVLAKSGVAYRLDSASLVRTANAPAAAAAPATAPTPSSTPSKPAPTTASSPAAPAPAAASPGSGSGSGSGITLGVVSLGLGG
jgi:uncharacterized protein YkwD